MSDSEIEELEIRGDMVRLGQVLKFSGLVGTGGEAKNLLLSGDVEVNGEQETRRGRQLHAGDTISVPGAGVLRLVASEKQ